MSLNAVVNQVQDSSFVGENIRIKLSYFIFLSLSVRLYILQDFSNSWFLYYFNFCFPSFLFFFWVTDCMFCRFFYKDIIILLPGDGIFELKILSSSCSLGLFWADSWLLVSMQFILCLVKIILESWWYICTFTLHLVNYWVDCYD